MSGYPFYGHEMARISGTARWEARVVLVSENGRRVVTKKECGSWFEADEWGERECASHRLCPRSSVG
jgi:hypothetical protein